MLTLKQIGDVYNVGKKAINSWFKKYNISKISNAERKYFHLRQIPLTQVQREFIIGTLLGDGSLVNTGKFKRLTMGHSVKQLEYLLWKKEILGELVRRIYKQVQISRNSIIMHCATIGHQDFDFFYNLFYNVKKVIKPELETYLTPFGMAVWYMDDGSAKEYCVKLCTEGFSKEENTILQYIIFKKFNIRCKIYSYSGYYYLAFNKKNSILLCSLIKKYVIKSMQYKLPF